MSPQASSSRTTPGSTSEPGVSCLQACPCRRAQVRWLTYEQIAAELGYANRGTVYRIVSEALKGQTVGAVAQLRNLEFARLDKLQLALWPAALAGDVPSVIAAARCIMAACSGCWAQACSVPRILAASQYVGKTS